MRVLLAGICAVLFGLAGLSAQAADTYSVVDGKIEQPLTAQAGDPKNGRAVMINRKKGNCLACHAAADMSDQLFHGEVGPTLDGVAERYSAAELRLIVVNSKAVFEDTIMPAFFKDDGFTRIRQDYVGKSILTAQEVEDVVAYLATLME